jgi:hypothetical protein
MRVSILAVFATLALAVSVMPSAASADNGNVSVTFTKWVIGDTDPTDVDMFDMVGTVGGGAGAGKFFGEVFSLSTSPDGSTTNIRATYHINGSNAAFVADNNVTQDNIAGTATITGTVLGGTMAGAVVTGSYRVQAACTIPTPGNTYGSVCYRGTLVVSPTTASP